MGRDGDKKWLSHPLLASFLFYVAFASANSLLALVKKAWKGWVAFLVKQPLLASLAGKARAAPFPSPEGMGKNAALPRWGWELLEGAATLTSSLCCYRLLRYSPSPPCLLTLPSEARAVPFPTGKGMEGGGDPIS
jgi:hypothetical protein